MSNPRKAGTIVLKKFGDEYKVLVLRFYRIYDIPKGHVEAGEDIWEAALRETEEETGITDLFFRWGVMPLTHGNITVFIAETTEEPVIRPNPETGKIEHHQSAWMSFAEAQSKVHTRIKPLITLAQNAISDYI